MNTKTTLLSSSDSLPLTCSRTGTCCHGKAVWINPWELARLAKAKEISAREFRDQYCEFGGIQLKFNGEAGWKELNACSQYNKDNGCSVHVGRPLACRLYPLGRQRKGDTAHYMHEGAQFPCLEGCPEVVELPKLTVGDYIVGQEAGLCESAQDAYLDLMQQLADGAFALLIDTGLAASGDRDTLTAWRSMGEVDPGVLENELGQEWLDRLVLPSLNCALENPLQFCNQHYDALQEAAQEEFGSAATSDEMKDASIIMMGLALHLGRSLGAQPKDLSEHWIKTAKEHGASE
ncbi:MAG: YkgJ family cysteine cluster protein [Fibrobacterales bacterium]